MKDGIPRYNFDQVLSDDKTLYNWLVGLEQIGLSILEGCPTTEGTLRVLGERVSHLKRTNYGEIFTVKAKMDPSNLAYTSLELGMHTDLPYYDYAPGVQMLHCLKQVPTQGGENEFVDCFQVGELMRKYHPEEFELLTTLPIDYKDVGADSYNFHLLNKLRVIELDNEGAIVRIVWNNMMRDSFLTGVQLERVKPLYKAMKLFHDLMYHKDNVITTKLEAGEMVCFHNYRVLHGRTRFEVTEKGERHYEGAYLDWDEVSSRRRTIKRSIEPDTFGY
ncbi:hypothetical protein CAPTEDRAFT_152626 [Capitella teleta]|uniref:TauD/TfdA-like domain-containing protein n=1 Tax=Capitella teleta TaxID=283909 RepID=R7T7R3_CAPTE|nr:hypothetical protein CAPTEDRAFT_152626 [Capitella teleta]|eukprot:ELT89689.1 hypothetical protein CAPTEDRAFT_152626 [Capitella teleta]